MPDIAVRRKGEEGREREGGKVTLVHYQATFQILRAFKHLLSTY